jgi:opacity protein-like surface antigen
MKVISIVSALFLVSLPCWAGEPIITNTNPIETPPPDLSFFRAHEWDISAYAGYATHPWRGENRAFGDHMWGGGVEGKYFPLRWVGVGLEGDVFRNSPSGDATGNVAGNLYLRYPIEHSNFHIAPYVMAGVGGFFSNVDHGGFFDPAVNRVRHHHNDSDLFEGHVGGGLEYRFTRHLGAFADARYVFVEGSKNDYPLIRWGLTWAF